MATHLTRMVLRTLTYHVQCHIQRRRHSIRLRHVIVFQRDRRVTLARRRIDISTQIHRHDFRISACHGHAIRLRSRNINRNVASFATRRLRRVLRTTRLLLINRTTRLDSARVHVTTRPTNALGRTTRAFTLHVRHVIATRRRLAIRHRIRLLIMTQTTTRGRLIMQLRFGSHFAIRRRAVLRSRQRVLSSCIQLHHPSQIASTS